MWLILKLKHVISFFSLRCSLFLHNHVFSLFFFIKMNADNEIYAVGYCIKFWILVNLYTWIIFALCCRFSLKPELVFPVAFTDDYFQSAYNFYGVVETLHLLHPFMNIWKKTFNVLMYCYIHSLCLFNFLFFLILSYQADKLKKNSSKNKREDSLSFAILLITLLALPNRR